MSMEKMKKEAQEKVFSDRYRTGTWSTTEWENGFEAGWNSRDEVPRCDICGRESGLASGIGFFDACNCRTPEERLAILRNSEYFAGSRQTLEAISPQLSEQQLEIARLTSALEVAVGGLGHYADKELWKKTETGRPYKDWYQPFRHGYDIARETLAEVQRLKEGK